MANTTFFLKVNGLTRFKAPIFTPSQVRAIGGAAIHELQERLDANKNVYDAPAKPYSPKGPIYVPISGRGMTKSGLKRNKSNLGGREIFTTKDMKKMKVAGVLVVKSGTAAVPKAGQVIARDTGKSLKFANYAEYKRALGKSGLRDNQLSGRMRNAIAIVSLAGSKCEIGFTRELEHLKARGNQKIDPWFGLSPSNKKAVIEFAKTLLPAVVKAMTN